MDNRNPDSADNRPTPQPTEQPTQQLGPVGAQGPGQPGGGPPRAGRATRWGIGIAAAAILIGGGAALVASGRGTAGLASSTSPASQAARTTKAALNTVLSSADSPNAADLAAASPTPGQAAAARPCARMARGLRATGHPRAARRARAVCRGRAARLRLLVRGIHGQFTYQTKQGAKTLAFERGTIQSVSGTAVTVAASDGTTWTWHLAANTVVRRDGKKVGAADLATGQRVFVGGPVANGADSARLIIIRPAASTARPTS